MDTDELQLEHFTPLLDDEFVADFGDDGTLDFTLTEAVAVNTGNAGETAFSLLFRGPIDRVFAQGYSSLEHPAIGRHHLFCVAVNENETGRFYEVIFSRLDR